MKYEVLVLDLDGTLTNSRKEISEATKEGLLEIQKAGKIIVLASGRPVNGVAPIAEELEMHRYNGYMLSFNGGRIAKCSTGEIIYNRTLPPEVIRPIWEYAQTVPGLDVISYSDTQIISGDPSVVKTVIAPLQEQYQDLLNIYLSEPFFLEIMPRNIDKAYALQKLLSHLGLTAENMICCGDGFNDLSMIKFAGLDVAMANAQPAVKEAADFITYSNDEDGILHVIDLFL